MGRQRICPRPGRSADLSQPHPAADRILCAGDGPFGEQLETFASPAFAVCDHQLAHVYVNDPSDNCARIADSSCGEAGVDRVYAGERAEIGLNHARAGDWSFWRSRTPGSRIRFGSMIGVRRIMRAPSIFIASRATIHASCSSIRNCFGQRARAMARVLQKKLGLRALVDVIPLDAALVRGSHGLASKRSAGSAGVHRFRRRSRRRSTWRRARSTTEF